MDGQNYDHKDRATHGKKDVGCEPVNDANLTHFTDFFLMYIEIL